MQGAKKVCLAAAVAVAWVGVPSAFAASVKHFDGVGKVTVPPGQAKKVPPAPAEGGTASGTAGTTTETGTGTTGGTTGTGTTSQKETGKPAGDNDHYGNPDPILDLTTEGAAQMRNGAWFLQTDPQPTGTGVLQPFVRIQEEGSGDGVESGYNTDYRPIDGSTTDTKDENQWNHSLNTYLQTVEYSDGNGGTKQYVQFLLDVNEAGDPANRIIWLDKVEIYLADQGNLTYPVPLQTGDATHAPSKLIYSLDFITTPNSVAARDTGSGADATVKIDYKLREENSKPGGGGSGEGDMYLLVDASLFEPGKFVYLFSEFSGAEAGFEEWAARTTAPVAVPLPAGAAGGLALLAALGTARAARSRRRHDEF